MTFLLKSKPCAAYQTEGIAAIYNHEASYGRVILADDMGLGKTFMSLAVFSCTYQIPVETKEPRGHNHMTLVVCPKTLLQNWRQEILKHTTLTDKNIVIYHGSKRRKMAMLPPDTIIVLTTFQSVNEDCSDDRLIVSDTQRWVAGVHKGVTAKIRHLGPLFQVGRWQRVVMDEAHTVRNPKSRALRAICSLPAQNRWVISGTLFNNYSSDMSSMCEFLRLQPQNSPKWWQDALAADIVAFRSKHLIRRDNSVLKLPEKFEQVVIVPLEPTEQTFYFRLLKESLAKYERLKRMGYDNFELYQHGLVLLLRIRQCCNAECLTVPAELCIRCSHKIKHLEQYELLNCRRHVVCLHCEKPNQCFVCDGSCYPPSSRTRWIMQHTEKILTENDTNALIVFSQWSSYLTLLEPELVKRNIPYLRLDGQVCNLKDRHDVVQNFQNATGPRILLSTYAGGIGLTMTRANHVIIADSWYNPQVEAQAVGRAYRLGQTRPVHVFRLQSDMVVDDLVSKLKANKMQSANFFVTGEASERPSNKAGISFTEMIRVFRKLESSVPQEKEKKPPTSKRKRTDSKPKSAKRVRFEAVKPVETGDSVDPMLL
jgi:SNF2 family DNA or RNA helicase